MMQYAKIAEKTAAVSSERCLAAMAAEGLPVFQTPAGCRDRVPAGELAWNSNLAKADAKRRLRSTEAIFSFECPTSSCI